MRRSAASRGWAVLKAHALGLVTEAMPLTEEIDRRALSDAVSS
jgi:hypothetical protein